MLESEKLLEDSEEFLRKEDKNDILLSSRAAIEACIKAFDFELSVGRVEGGQWLNPGFMSRMDSIWDAGRDATSAEEVRDWNLSACEFIRQQAQKSPDPGMPPADAFILVAKKFHF